MAKRRIRYAVIGLGNIAQVAVLPAFAHAKKNSKLAALVSSDLEKLDELGRKYDVEHLYQYEDFDQLAASGAIDAVYIALPNSMHKEWTEKAARAGLHVLCEKPMAIDEAECKAMIDVTERHRVRLMIAYRLHFEEANLRAIEIVRSGKIGEPRFMSSTFSHNVREGDIRKKPELGGGALYDLGVYCINAARYLFRDEPVEVFGHVSEGDGVDDAASAMLMFPEGRVAQFTVSQGATSVSSYRIVGTEGNLLVDPSYEYTTPLRLELTVGDDTHRQKISRRDQFAPELLYFSECILDGKEPEPSGEEGLADVRVVTALLQSARERRPVTLPPFERRRRPDIGQEIHKAPVAKQETVHAPSPSTH